MAVCCGKLTVAATVPAGMMSSKSAKATTDLREAVLRAWPAVIAVMCEVNPRDATAEAEFLKISVSAFDPAAAWHAGLDPIEYLVKPVLKEMQTKYARYLASGGVEPTWKEVAAQTAVDMMLRFTLKSALASQAATAPPQQQLTQAQQQAQAAEAARSSASRPR